MGELMRMSMEKPFPIFSLLCAAFIAALYIQSGLDKVTDREGNLGWLKQHFGKSFLKGVVAPMFYTVMLLEIGSAVLCTAGILQIVIMQKAHLAFLGVTVSAINLVCLFAGQRFAKDYAGAAALVPYFILSIIAMMICGIGF